MPLLLGLQILGLGDPVQVAPEVLLQLLLLPQLLEVAAGLRLLPLLGELTVAGAEWRMATSEQSGRTKYTLRLLVLFCITLIRYINSNIDVLPQIHSESLEP